MREKSNGSRFFLWWMMIGVTLIMSAGMFLFPQEARAQGRGNMARTRNHNRASTPQKNNPKPGDKVNLEGTCRGTLSYSLELGEGEKTISDAVIDFKPATPPKETGSFSITGTGLDNRLSSGSLSVITRSNNTVHLSLSVNLTSDPLTLPVFTLSLRGCYNRPASGETCETPAKGPGQLDNIFRLNTVPGDPRKFSFKSESCDPKPTISKL
jgi:hypothetical protein